MSARRTGTQVCLDPGGARDPPQSPGRGCRPTEFSSQERGIVDGFRTLLMVASSLQDPLQEVGGRLDRELRRQAEQVAVTGNHFRVAFR